METAKVKTEELVLGDKIENLIAIGAATAANCIPCFEHLYENSEFTHGHTKTNRFLLQNIHTRKICSEFVFLARGTF